jgi:transposase
MEALLTHVAGVDVHKEILVITALIGPADEEPEAHLVECATFTEDLEVCGKKLKSLGVTHIAMESTGIYWKPVYNVWSRMGFRITLGNATHMKNVPGRKTDIKDSHWIAILHRSGLIRPSYIPESEFQELRALTRHRKNLVEDAVRVKHRVQKVLEDGNIKLGSVINNVFGVAGMAVLNAIAEGVTHPDDLAYRVKTQIKRKEDLRKSLTNCLTENHRFLIQQLMLQYLDLQKRIDEVEKLIDQKMAKHSELLKRLIEIPGIEENTAQGIIAEATTNMSVFKDDRTFAAWAGVAPGNNESAGKKKELKLEMETQL